MSRYDRKMYFERLVALRDAYAAETHETLPMTIDELIAFAEAALAEPPAAETEPTDQVLAPREAGPSTSD